MIDLADLSHTEIPAPPRDLPVTFRVGDRVMVTCGKPGAWPRPGRVTSVTDDPPRRGGIAVGVQFRQDRGSIYFSTDQLAHID